MSGTQTTTKPKRRSGRTSRSQAWEDAQRVIGDGRWDLCPYIIDLIDDLAHFAYNHE